MSKKKPSKPRELDEDELLLLVEDFKNFLRVGRVEYSDWDGLGLQAKAALTKAARELEAESIVKLAGALSSRRGLLRLAAEFDGGESFVEGELAEGLRSVLRKRGIAT